ncbi:hypothetical protein [Spirosoma aerophilum]
MTSLIELTGQYLPYLYYGGLLLLLMAISYPIRANRSGVFQDDRLFFSLAMLWLLMARLPSIVFAAPLNVDESQMIAEALTLLRDPVYWHSVDGTTIGPINSYLLAWPGLLHWPITYVTTRLTGTLLLGLTSWFLLAAMRRVISAAAARISLLCLLLFLGFTTYFDFLHCSSELPALPIIAYTWYVFIRFIQQPAYLSQQRTIWLITGVVAGLIPFVKLQAVPIIGLIVGALAINLVRHARANRLGLGNNQPLFWLLTACLLPSLLVVVLCTWYGVVDRFYLFYLKSNLFNYSEYYKELYPNTQLPIWAKLARLPYFLTDEPTFRQFFALCLLAATLAGGARLSGRKKIASFPPKLIGWSLGWLATACFVVAVPATEYPHHLWFVLMPLSWLLSLAIQECLTGWDTSRVNPALPAAMICIPSLIHTVDIYQTGIQQANPYLYLIQKKIPIGMDPVSSVIRAYARTDDRLVVWGWQNRYHVDTQLPQGTSENTSFRSMYPHSLRGAYQEKYLVDIQTNRPTFFLDATGPNSLFMTDTVRYRFERFPALARYITHHYRFVGQLDQVRIYLRNDRARGSQLSFQKETN